MLRLFSAVGGGVQYCSVHLNNSIGVVVSSTHQVVASNGGHGMWRNRLTFIFAATGSAVGLGNIWKFPYIAGENGGGAFVLVYLVCIAMIGIPIMMAEVMLGRRGRMSPIHSMLSLSKEAGVSRWWSSIAWSGVLAGVFILSFYSVIAGWSLHYIFLSLSGELSGINAPESGAVFRQLLADTSTLTIWHTVFMLMTIGIVSAGVIRGLGRAVGVMMPILFGLLLILLVYSVVQGNFSEGWNFLFAFDSSRLEWSSVLDALGHAFFTLSVGMGAMMAYGAYMPEQKTSLGNMVITVAVLDTFVALIAGLVIFPIVFATDAIQPSAGPGLLFVSLPVAFGSMLAGQLFAVLFFILITIAALSSAISIIEPSVAWLVEHKAYSRPKAVVTLGLLIWFVGFGTLFSFNHWADITLFGMTFFDTLDFLTANIMLPLGGLLIALFVGWRMRRQAIIDEVGSIEKGINKWWMRILRYVSPLLVIIVFVMSLVKKFSEV